MKHGSILCAPLLTIFVVIFAACGTGAGDRPSNATRPPVEAGPPESTNAAPDIGDRIFATGSCGGLQAIFLYAPDQSEWAVKHADWHARYRNADELDTFMKGIQNLMDFKVGDQVTLITESGVVQRRVSGFRLDETRFCDFCVILDPVADEPVRGLAVHGRAVNPAARLDKVCNLSSLAEFAGANADKVARDMATTPDGNIGHVVPPIYSADHESWVRGHFPGTVAGILSIHRYLGTLYPPLFSNGVMLVDKAGSTTAILIKIETRVVGDDPIWRVTHLFDLEGDGIDEAIISAEFIGLASIQVLLWNDGQPILKRLAGVGLPVHPGR